MKQTLRKVEGVESLWISEQSGLYYMLCKRDGRQLKRSLRTDKYVQAKRNLRVELGDLETKAPLDVATRPSSFKELVKAYLDFVVPTKDLKEGGIKDISYRALALNRYTGFDTRPVEKISRLHCQQWFGMRRKTVSASRVNTETALLKNVFDFAVQNVWRRDNPAACLPRLKYTPGEGETPTRQEFATLRQQLRSNARRDAADFVELMSYSGLRCFEAAKLRWMDVDFEGNTWKLFGGKKRKENEFEEVPLFPNMKKLLLDVLAARGGRKNIDPTMPIMRIAQCRDALKVACETAKLKNFTHHSLRRFFSDEAVLRHGFPIPAVARWMRHKDGGALLLKRYTKLQMGESLELAKRFTFDFDAVVTTSNN